MTGPPSKKPPADLAEVERALSILHGRHPEHERTRREDEERKAERRAEIDANAKVARRRSLKRNAVVAVAVLVVGGVAAVAAVFARAELLRRERLERVARPFEAFGFAMLESTPRASTLQASVPAGCLLAVSTSGGALRLTRPGGIDEGPSPILTCLCEGGAITLGSQATEGLALMRADPSALGGTRALAFLPFKPGTIARADKSCEETEFDAWLDAKHAPTSIAGDAAASDRWLAPHPVLRSSGFKLLATVKADVPFAMLEIPSESCVLAVSDDTVSFRVKGGSLAAGPSSKGLAWCTSNAANVLAQHDGAHGVDVLVAPAARVGGLFGLMEAAALSRIPIGATALAAADRGWSAKQILLASGVPEGLVSVANAPDLGSDAEARIVALSLDRPNGIRPELGDDVYSFCDPALATSTTPICIFSGPQRWRIEGAEAVGGLARAKLPFWLFGMQTEPEALKVATEIITLARKLRRQGFEPTTIEAVTELDQGAEVLGRANEDAIVALTIVPAAPWAFPYTDGPAWTLEGTPRILPIKPLERITVRATTKKLPPKEQRHTVIFRRHT